MSFASTSVAPGSYPCVRRNLTTGVAVASAGILALGLVVVPPDFDGVRTELRTVQFASFTLPSVLPPGALLEKVLTSGRAQSGAPGTVVVFGGAKDIAAVPTAALTVDPATDPAVEGQQVNNAALPSPTAISIPEALLPIIGPIILFAPLFILLIPLLPVLLPAAAFYWVQSAISELLYNLSPPPDPALATTAMVEAKATLTSDQLPSDSGLATLTKKQREEVAPAADKAKAEGSPAVASTKHSSEIEQMPPEQTASKEDVVETAKGSQSPKPEKPSVRPPTNSSVARGLTEVRERVSDLRHPDRLTTKAVTGGKKAETDSPSVEAATPPSPKDRNSPGDSTPKGDTDDS